jgi:hypothetical protein
MMIITFLLQHTHTVCYMCIYCEVNRNHQNLKRKWRHTYIQVCLKDKEITCEELHLRARRPNVTNVTLYSNTFVRTRAGALRMAYANK